MRRLVVLLAAVGVVAGCSTSIAGTPSPEPGATAASPAANGLTPSPRPRELRLDGIDSCAPLTPARLEEFGLDRTVPSAPTIAPPEGNICAAGGYDTKFREATIAFLTNPGIEWITTLRPGPHDGLEPVQVAGFPGIIEPQDEEPTSCVVDVDVATGQFINVSYADADRPPTLSRAEICRGATSLAEEVVRFLMGN
jgi:hypothetical protein